VGREVDVEGAGFAGGTAANASLDELRRRRRRPLVSVGDDHHEVADHSALRAVDDIADRLSDGPSLDAALAALPDDFRLPVVLRDVADLDYAEIAAALAIPVGTVKSRIARGRAQLARHLGFDPGNRDATDRRPTEAP
ncbi:MAG: sigma factor-like helix-turn-helix DNA-binding protein, partial [Ilumatobacteraceae bacterium]